MRMPELFRPSRSIYVRLTLWVMLTVLIIFGIITYIVSAVTRDAVVDGTLENTMSRMEISNQRINNVLTGVEVAVENTIPEVESSLETPDKMYDVVRRLLELNPSIVGSTVAFEPDYYPSKGMQFSPYAYKTINGTIETKQLGTAEYEYHYMDWYQIPKLLKRNYWSEPYYDRGGGEQMMTTYSRPLYDKQGRMYAIITADVSLDWLTELVKANDIDFNKKVLHSKDEDVKGELKDDFFFTHAYTFIIGRSGTYIAHPLHERILNDTYFTFAFETENDSIDDHIGYDMVEGKTGMDFICRDGVKYMVTYMPIERTGWSMATIVPTKTLFETKRAFTLSVIGMMLFGILLLFLVCHRIIKHVTKPLWRFANSADEISRGNLNAKLPEVTTNDEMKRLHDSFDQMQTSLVKQMDELKEVNAQKGRIEGELKVARNIQMSMLPKIFPPYPERDDIEIFGRLTPAKEVGGDLFDFFIRDEKLFFCIGDVSGKGVPASLVMAVIRAMFRTIAAHEALPDRIATSLNETMAEGNDSNMFVTFFVGVLDLPTGRLRYCNAGHDQPLLIGGKVGLLPCDSNIPVGVMAGWKFTLQETIIDPQTTIFLYTDGLTEAENLQHMQFGEQRVKETAEKLMKAGEHVPDILIDKMTDAVHAFVGEAEQSDDLTMLGIQYTKQQLNTRLQRSIVLSNDVQEVPQLAAFVDEVCEALDFDAATTMQMNLAIEEAVVNVMNYAYPAGTTGYVNISASVNAARLKITINGVPFDPTAKAEVDTTLSVEERGIGGLGIHLIRQIMDSINYEHVDGKNVLTLRKKLTQENKQ